MESRKLLISIIDTASLAVIGLDQIDRLIADLLAGADVPATCSLMLRITNKTRERVQFEHDIAERQRNAGA